jgi:hypothetical protein
VLCERLWRDTSQQDEKRITTETQRHGGKKAREPESRKLCKRVCEDAGEAAKENRRWSSMKHLFYPILIISLLTLISSCAEDPEPKPEVTEPPRVVSTVPPEGGINPPNAMVWFTLDKEMASVAITGAAGSTVIDGKRVGFTPSPPLPKGTVTLTITGTDMQGGELEEFTLTFAAVSIVCPPVLDGRECDPMDGAANVDPGEYPEGLKVAFNEDLKHAKITFTKPEFDFTLTITDHKLMIEFVDYTMPYETKFEIGITATDLAHNSGDVIYSFTTTAKVER